METDIFNENKIKSEFLNVLRRQRLLSRNSILATEYVLGTTGRRADLAVLNGHQHIGIEIKSRFDSLDRLPGQLEVYKACFDKVVLVVDRRHLEKANALIDPTLELWSLCEAGHFHREQEAEAFQCKNSAVASRLLTESAMKKLLSIPTGEAIKRTILLEKLSILPDQLIFEAIRNAFFECFHITTKRFWNAIGRKKIRQSDLAHLSRFATLRSEAESNEQTAREFWASWQNHARAALRNECA